MSKAFVAVQALLANRLVKQVGALIDYAQPGDTVFGCTTNASNASGFGTPIKLVDEAPWEVTCSGAVTAQDACQVGTNGVVISNPARAVGSALTNGVDGGLAQFMPNAVASAGGATPARVVVTLTDAATIAVDASKGSIFDVTLGGNRAMGTPTNPVDGQVILFRITQDGSGNRTLSWPGSAFAWSTTVPVPTLSTGAGKLDLVSALYDAAVGKWLGTAVSLGY